MRGRGRGIRHQAIFQAWHGELYHRQKSLPELASLLRDDDPDDVQRRDNARLVAWARRQQAAGAPINVTVRSRRPH